MCSVIEELKNEGFQQGMQQGMQTFADLTKKLLALHRTNDLNRAIEDEQYRDQLMKELAIQQAYPLNSPQGEFFICHYPSQRGTPYIEQCIFHSGKE